MDVWAWGRGLESWFVQHLIVDSGPGRAETWAKMDPLFTRTWKHAFRKTPMQTLVDALRSPKQKPMAAQLHVDNSRPQPANTAC